MKNLQLLGPTRVLGILSTNGSIYMDAYGGVTRDSRWIYIQISWECICMYMIYQDHSGFIRYLSIDLYDPDISRFVTSLDPIWRNEALGHVNAKDKRITWPPISLWHHLIDYKDI